MASRTVLASFVAGALCLSPALAAAQETTETYLPALSIYGGESPSQATPNEARDVARLRSGIGFFSLGLASSDQGNGGGGVGLSAHLGVQLNRLIGIYGALRGHTLLFTGDAELDAIVDFTLLDRVQLGLGIGGYAAYSVFSYGPAALGFVFPFHFGVTPALWRDPGGRRHGFQIALDLAPGVAADRYYYGGGVHFGGSAQLGIGWEWY